MNARGNENTNFAQQARVKAFLDLIARAEGTYGVGDNGYDVLYGFGRFQSYAAHPNKAVKKGGWTSTAAGRYQFLKKTWDGVASKIGAADFSPSSQDAGAVELIREKNGLNNILTGDIAGAISKVRKVWASFPGAGYGQGERSLASMLAWYQNDLVKYGGPPLTQQQSSGGAMQATLLPGLQLGSMGDTFMIILLIGAALYILYTYLR